ncbi:MAG: hypothetical protein KDD04_12370, partial [Sinomicrobium sp.]|nr:hypothetical protein [Sinomicrobium sp.]
MDDTSVKAGRLTSEYKNGFLRYIRLGNTELVRMIYFALRDKNWNTLPLRIVAQTENFSPDAFSIEYTAENLREEQAVVRWDVRIEGTADEKISFTFTATFLSDFIRNRAGFCLLHPLRETIGQAFLVTHPDGSTSEGHFPKQINPHQPCIDITQFSWSTDDGTKVLLAYEGDIFEMEDQRNWS